MKNLRITITGLLSTLAVLSLAPWAAGQWNIREVIKINDILENSDDAAGFEHYQNETVRFTVILTRDGKKVSVPTDAVPTWKAWAAGDTSTLLINKSGSIVKAGKGEVKVELTTAESALDVGTYITEMRLLSADLVDMGIIYYTTNHVVNYSSTGGTLTPPNADTDMGGWSIIDVNYLNATGGVFDVDRNTGIKVEESADENIIRFDTAGTERFRVEADGALFLVPTDAEPTGAEGRLYWDDSENTVKAYNGTAWVAVGLAGATAHSGLTGLTTGDDHTQYGKLDEAETVSGNWTFTGNAVNTANPWADNEVADSLTVSEAGIAAAITRDSEWDTFAELQTAVSDKTLINEEDAARFDVMLSVGSGSGDSTSGPGDLYVQDIIEADGGANIAGTLTVGTIEEFATDGGVTVNDALIFPQQHVDLTEESSPVTLTAAQSKFGFITVDDAMTINLASPVVGMTFTILVLDDVVVTIDGNGNDVWMDGTTDDDPETIVNSGSAGECISLFWDGTAWRAFHVEGSWTI